MFIDAYTYMGYLIGIRAAQDQHYWPMVADPEGSLILDQETGYPSMRDALAAGKAAVEYDYLSRNQEEAMSSDDI